MLLSMTGIGAGRCQNERLAITVELKSVNNKHLKISFRTPDSYLALEHDLDKLVRAQVHRGTVYVNLFADRVDRAHEHGLDLTVLQRYWEQTLEAARSLNAAPPQDVTALLSLPGVVTEERHHAVEDEDWPLIETAMNDALQALAGFRRQEGAAMRAELQQLLAGIEAGLATIVERAPAVVIDYRQKLLQRVRDLLAGSEARVQESDLIRELSLYADRTDITEEITRLRSHLQQFHQLLATETSPGRKLDFLCQEMFREINTMGSKGNDIAIAHTVVHLKTSVEKMREIVQNIE